MVPRSPAESGPDAREREQRPIFIQREPHRVFLAGLWVGLRCVFGEAIGRDQAAVFRL